MAKRPVTIKVGKSALLPHTEVWSVQRLTTGGTWSVLSIVCEEGQFLTSYRELGYDPIDDIEMGRMRRQLVRREFDKQ